MVNQINNEIFQPFSNPFVAGKSDIVSVIANASSKNIVSRFFDEFNNGKMEISSDISDGFINFEKLDLPVNTCWDPVIGKLEKFLQEKDMAINNHLINLMCYLSIKGIVKDWKIDVSVAGDLFFDRYTIKDCTYSSVAHDSHTKCLLFSDTGKLHKLFYASNDPGRNTNTFFIESPRVISQDKILYAYLQDSRKDIGQYLADFVESPKPVKNKANVKEGLQILKNYIPEYHSWVTTITKQVIIYNSPSRNQIKSGSWYDLPGVYNFSVNHDPLLIAEMLVHESSHQYFNLLKRFADVAINTEVKYFSPAVKKMRPVWLILFAYHAFANVLVLYRMLAKYNCFDQTQMKIRISEMEPLVAELEGNLIQAEKLKELTPIGLSVFHPLYNQLRSV